MNLSLKIGIRRIDYTQQIALLNRVSNRFFHRQERQAEKRRKGEDGGAALLLGPFSPFPLFSAWRSWQ
jgi:hypothetical protein